MLRAVALSALLVSATSHGLETLRIAMGEQVDSVEIIGSGLTFGQDSEDGPFTRVTKGRATVQRNQGRLLLDGVPVLGDSIRFRGGAWAQDAGVPGLEVLRAAGLDVRGDVVVKLRGERLLLINVISLEDYVAAVLGGEMPVAFPAEALKAQAVAARTYALRKKIEAYGADFHLGSSVLSQVYGGSNRENPRTRAAQESTRGEVLTYELEPIEAYFHASCGGHTESGLEALNRDLPYLKSVECPCGKLPLSHWSVSVPTRELTAALRGADVASFAVISRSATGRARRVRIGPDRTLDAVTVRERLGYARLKSLDFSVTRDGAGAVRLDGRGFGHGAGLCQWGAKILADQGWDYRRILDRYYPGTERQVLY